MLSMLRRTFTSWHANSQTNLLARRDWACQHGLMTVSSTSAAQLHNLRVQEMRSIQVAEAWVRTPWNALIGLAQDRRAKVLMRLQKTSNF